MSLGLTLALLLAGASPERDAARLELDHVAARIEQLKARSAMGDDVHVELHRLLVRAQELAITLDRLDHPQPDGSPPPRVRGPTPDELRERADEARDEADRIRGEIARIDRRMASLQSGLPEGRLADAGPRAEATLVPPAQRLGMLEAQREQLLRRLAMALRTAERLEIEARVIEGSP